MTDAQRPAPDREPADEEHPGQGDLLADANRAVVRSMMQPAPSPVTTTVRAFLADLGPVPDDPADVVGWLRDCLSVASTIARLSPFTDVLDALTELLDAANGAVGRLAEGATP